MGRFVNRLGLIALDLFNSYPVVDSAKMLLPFIDLESYLQILRDEDLVRSMQVYFMTSDTDRFSLTIDGESISPWHLLLNTALCLGDQVRLMARLYAQCECYCYIEPEHREWVATIIDKGRQQDIYRPNMGWESVAEFLRGDSEGIVVISYSVCDTFPHSYIADYEGEVEDWEELDRDKQWELGVKGLKSDEKWKGLEINPDHGIYFGNGFNAFQLRQKALEYKEAQCQNAK